MRVLDRRGLLLTVALAVLPMSGATAGNADRYDVIGFADGIFFFEQFGDFDAIGGGHSTIFAVDLATDTWLPGTPVLNAVGDSNPELLTITVAELRRRSREQLAPILAALEPLEYGRSMARRVFGQAGVGSRELSWRVPSYGNMPFLFDLIHTLRLDAFTTEITHPVFGDTCLGYALTYNGTEIYRDAGLPRSRGCPVSYELEEVICAGFGETCVVLIAVYNFGFEGWDRDYIAAPFDMDL